MIFLKKFDENELSILIKTLRIGIKKMDIPLFNLVDINFLIMLLKLNTLSYDKCKDL